jgi:tripartite-type tricarboxylate transporter receptor subunit TctC
VRLVALPDVKRRLAAVGFEPLVNTPEECAVQFRTELAKWSTFIRQANIRVQ